MLVRIQSGSYDMFPSPATINPFMPIRNRGTAAIHPEASVDDNVTQPNHETDSHKVGTYSSGSLYATPLLRYTVPTAPGVQKNVMFGPHVGNATGAEAASFELEAVLRLFWAPSLHKQSLDRMNLL